MQQNVTKKKLTAFFIYFYRLWLQSLLMSSVDVAEDGGHAMSNEGMVLNNNCWNIP